jgi:ketosteroid isomerase-like protein
MSPTDTTPTDRTAATRAVVETFLQRLTGGATDRLAELFAEDVDWLIPGDQRVAPWVGRRSSRAEVAAFYRMLAANVEPLHASVDSFLVEGEVAVIVGDFASRMRATGKVVESLFSIAITVRNGLIARYRLLEDSHAVVVALT